MAEESKTSHSNEGESFQKILIIRMSSIGDVLFALPALELLRSSYPNAHISWVVEDRAADILQGHSHIDELIVMPRRQWKDLRRDGNRLEAFMAAWRFFRGLRRRKFDLSIDFQANLKSGLASFSARAPVRLGFARSECREPNWLFTNRHHSLNGEVMHRIDRDLSLLSQLGISPKFKRPQVQLPEQCKREASAFIEGLRHKGPIVMLQPGTSEWGRNKKWSRASFAALGDLLCQKQDAHVILAWGSESERAEALELRQLMKGPSTLAPATNSLRSLGALMEEVDLLIGCDSGPTHLAEILGVKVVSLFGPSDPRLYHPYGHRENALYEALPCSPCRYRACVGRACMERITPDSVHEVCSAVMEGQKPDRAMRTPIKTVRL